MEVRKVLTYTKSTAGTHVYGEAGAPRDEAVFPALYLPKRLFAGEPPRTVTVILAIPD